MIETQSIKMNYLRHKSRAKKQIDQDRVIKISHLKNSLAWACQDVIESDQPIIIRRYKAQDVAIVPLWEWRFFKELEAQIKAGRCPVAKEEKGQCPCSLSK
jgi:hypothetical protein